MSDKPTFSAVCVVCGETRSLVRPPQSDTCRRCSSRRNGERARAAAVPRVEAPKVGRPVSFETEVAVENAADLLRLGESWGRVPARVGMSEGHLRTLLADKGIEVTT